MRILKEEKESMEIYIFAVPTGFFPQLHYNSKVPLHLNVARILKESASLSIVPGITHLHTHYFPA